MRQFVCKVKRKLSYVGNDLLFSVKLKKNDPSQFSQSSLMIVYHGIDQEGGNRFNSRFISQEYFEKQISYFKQYFNIVSLEQYYQRDFDPDKLNVCITFDDGYRNNLKYALPILEKYKVPASFFITTIRDHGMDHLWADYVDLACYLNTKDIVVEGEVFAKRGNGEYYSRATGVSLKITAKSKGFGWKEACMKALPDTFKSKKELEDYWKLLTGDEIRQLGSSEYITIGSHGRLHDCLGMIDGSKAREDVKRSKECLESVLGHRVDAIAYPDGSYTRELVEFGKELGLSKHLALTYLFQEDRADDCIRDRFGINPYCSWNNQLYSMLRGKYF